MLQWQKRLVQRRQHLKRKLRVVIRIHDDWFHTWCRRGDPSYEQLMLAWECYHTRYQRICQLEEELMQLGEQLTAVKHHHQP